MACNPARFARLPIPEAQKRLLIAFSQDPANDAMSTQLCNASDEEVVQVAAKLAPSQGQPQGAPVEQQGLGGLPPSAPAGPPNSPPQGNVPPGQLANVTRPMDTPPPTGQGNAGLGGLLNKGY